MRREKNERKGNERRVEELKRDQKAETHPKGIGWWRGDQPRSEPSLSHYISPSFPASSSFPSQTKPNQTQEEEHLVLKICVDPTLDERGSTVRMSCNGCRVLRKGCSDSCVLRPCLQWIESAEAQGHATVFVAKFFGRAGLLSFISAVPDSQRPALFQSLLFEAAGRTINPVNGAVGLLWTGNWHLCQAAVESVLRGGTLRPLPELTGEASPNEHGGLYTNTKAGGWSTFSTAKRCKTTVPKEEPVSPSAACDLNLCLIPREEKRRRPATPSGDSEESVTTDDQAPQLLNLFV
ncbi:hypothetical protein LUZ61_001603 [Rhynchospora tenuis]|uniref:LOB domain-containing protein n=1 Tax=Rhynchospora tenuis TaxID=198213 RepID=A0AAD5ZHI4_9POAL|nr:hypothetical protein LUZ61_001603 [Rhynchospora tenuis]